MKVDLEKLVADARRIQAGGIKVKYPAEFQQRAVNALAQIDEKELTKLLGLGSATLGKWRRNLSTKADSKFSKSTLQVRPIEFSPLLHPESTVTRPKQSQNLDTDPSSIQARFEFSDAHGRRLSMSIPWNAGVGSSLFELARQVMQGGTPCYK